MRRVWLLVLMLPGVMPHEAHANAASAFEVFKRLQGTWSITSHEKPIATKMTYDVGSRGSIVTEQFGKELSVFAVDGGRLIMTHYCNAGNQPRLQLKPGTPPGIFDFVMFDITGLDTPNARHVQEVVYRMNGPDSMKLSLIWTGEGTGTPEDYVLTRAAAAH